VHNRFIKISLVVIILLGQIGDKLAIASMPCEGESSGTMSMSHEAISHTDMQAHELAGKDTTSSHKLMASYQIMGEDCCDKDCCCPYLIESKLATALDFKNTQAESIANGLYFTFLAFPKQPPKPFYSLVG